MNMNWMGSLDFFYEKNMAETNLKMHESASENQIKFCKYRIVEEPVE